MGKTYRKNKTQDRQKERNHKIKGEALGCSERVRLCA